ncbi:MAG TPA: CHAT domain-containing protein [Kofleriaceae bacterium]|nr:CHAT domain-containing protein [Kofleriaceae bacterium]
MFESVFDARIRASLTTSRSMARNKGHGVRIRLHLDHAPELACLPWEYLYERDVDLHLALTTPIVRYSKLDDPPLALAVKPPLKILVMTASPTDRPRLDGDREWELINTALDGLQRAKLVQLHRVPRATVDKLQECLQQQEWHVFHFIGHSGCANDDAVVLFEDENGASRALTRADLNLALQHPTLRLAILNSCEGAKPLDADPLSGIAQGLVRARIPAVIAMQFKITDQGAVKFAKEFYSALANNLPVDHALTEARKAMFLARFATEWGTPVLFMRGDDGHVFNLKPRKHRPGRRSPPLPHPD